MKTTVEISDPLLQDVRQLAARENLTVRALIEEGLRKVLAERASSSEPFKLEDGSFTGNGLQPEFEGASWEKLRAAIYEGRGG